MLYTVSPWGARVARVRVLGPVGKSAAGGGAAGERGMLGTVMGADPLHALLHTGAGLACLVAGGALEALGLWWALGIVRRAETS